MRTFLWCVPLAVAALAGCASEPPPEPEPTVVIQGVTPKPSVQKPIVREMPKDISARN